LKRFMTSVKADVEQELRADELREILAQQQRELNTLKDSISDAGKEIEKETSAVGAALAEDLDQSARTAGQGTTATESEKTATADSAQPADQDQPEKVKT
ncbi:MAG: hypothetical protein OEO18_11290, partial [Gammaproteobacteria bacterium]|nr:hypothetical protein [Gammaproteobacteria bacterium]